MDNKDKRRYPRRPAELDVELTYPTGDTRTVKTRDISEGGLFIMLADDHMPPQGEIVGVKLVGDSADMETFPSTEAVVVHQHPDGIGLAFIEMELDED